MITKYGTPESEVSPDAVRAPEPGGAWTNVDPHAETEKISRKPVAEKQEVVEAGK